MILEADNKITRKRCIFLISWTACLIALYAITGFVGIRRLCLYKKETEQFRREWMESSEAAKRSVSEDVTPVEVTVGIYVNRIGDFSIRNNRWTAEFDIWFKWNGNDVAPGENFQIADGYIEDRQKREDYSSQGQNYERYHVRASMVKHFDATRFPFSEQGLVIQIQDAKHDSARLRYVGGTHNISPGAVPEFLEITDSGVLYNLQSEAGQKAHYRFIWYALILPPGIELYIRMLQALFASIAVSFIVLFIKPIYVDPRFGLPVGAFFAVVGNNIFIQSLLPVTNRISLVDMASGIGLITIFLVLAQSAVSLYIFDAKGERVSNIFDKASFVVLFLAYVLVNVLLPLAARA